MEFAFRSVDELLTRIVSASAARVAVHRHLALVVTMHAAGHLGRGHHAAGAGRGRAHTECGHERRHHESPIRHDSILDRDVGAIKSRRPSDATRCRQPSPR